ncbi:hypothetical protein, partial [Corynebacterium casei]
TPKRRNLALAKVVPRLSTIEFKKDELFQTYYCSKCNLEQHQSTSPITQFFALGYSTTPNN